MATASFEGFGLRVVVASDKFKGTLTSAEVAEAVGTGVRRVCPDATVIAVPVADGGDGTLAAAVAAGYSLVPVVASGPTGEPVESGYARSGTTAVVELADVSGLVRLPGGVPAPLTATSYGTGELIAAAVDAGCTRIILAIGGSASTDGGQGMINALAGRPLALPGNNPSFRDEKLRRRGHEALAGRPSPVHPGNNPSSGDENFPGHGEGALARSALGLSGNNSSFRDENFPGHGEGALAGHPSPSFRGNNVSSGDEKVPGCGWDVPVEAVRRRLEGVKVVVACDVDNPLTGPRGAAAVYGPQKGADPRQVAQLDASLTQWADDVARATGRDLRDTPGAGAAGGVGFAALALLGAELRPGIDLILEMVRFHEQIAGADLVVTGEGALDEQTLHGKAVAGVAAAARAAGRPTPGQPVSGSRSTAGRPAASRLAADRPAAGRLVDDQPAARRPTTGGPTTGGLTTGGLTTGGPTSGGPIPGRLAGGQLAAGRLGAGQQAGGAGIVGGGVSVVAVCGVNRLAPEQLKEMGIAAAYALTDVEPDVQRCIAEPRPLLEELGERIAVEHLTMTRTERRGSHERCGSRGQGAAGGAGRERAGVCDRRP